MNATLRISVFSQDTKNGPTTVELIVRSVDPASVPTECIERAVMWRRSVAVSYDKDDHTLTVENATFDNCKFFAQLVGPAIESQREKLMRRSATNSGAIREIQLDVPIDVVDTILARTSGYLDDALADQSDNDALGKLFGLTETDFGATDLFTAECPLDILDPQGITQLV